MKKLPLILTILLTPMMAFAQTLLPSGCYVTYSNPNFCYNIPTGQTLVWNASTNQDFLASSYGGVMAIVISRTAELELERNIYQEEYDVLLNDYDESLNLLGEAQAVLNKQKKKLRKLKKKIKKLRR